MHQEQRLPEHMLDPKTPAEVVVTDTPREPVSDSTLGISVEVEREGRPQHRLVAIGDSLTHGFGSGAIHNTDLSYPAIVANEMGFYERFRKPDYFGLGGLPLNLEFLIRDLESRFGDRIDWWETALAGFRARDFVDRVEDWWERGGGSRIPNVTGINHNLGIYGWDLRDILERTATMLESEIDEPQDQTFRQIVENANQRAALRVLKSAVDDDGAALTPLGAARALGEKGAPRTDPEGGHGIEVLVVFIGANNALPSLLSLRVAWSGEGYDDLTRKRHFTVWRPSHFRRELELVAEEVRGVRARHVIFCTVPHVTIAPVARGVGTKVRKGSRYFPFYTRPWTADRHFDAKNDPHITEQEARAVDSAIDQYNEAIVGVVRDARNDGEDWHLFDVAGLLDRLAARRYIVDPLARPHWWRRYDLPPELAALEPEIDSRFFASGPEGRTAGGLFSLDGVHPTTVGYGILAQELIHIMQIAGVKFYLRDGVTERTGPVKVDFGRLVARDTLISDPPRSLTSDLRLIGWLDENLGGIVGRMLF